MCSLILVIIGSICSAIMDTLKDHFPVSIFKNLNNQWWNPEISWKNKIFYKHQTNWKKYVPDSLSDAWHTFKTIMLWSLIGAIVFYSPIFYNYGYFIIYGFSWILVFNLFYNHLLVKR